MVVPLLVLMLSTSGAAPAAAAKSEASGNPYLEAARTSYQGLDYEKALASLKQALFWSGTTKAQLAEIHLLRGLCHFELGSEPNGRAAFRAALAADPSIQPPPLTSPKIKALFESEAASVRPTPPRPPEPAAASSPKAAPEPALPHQAPATAPPADVSRTPTRWPAYVTFGLAAVSLGVACAFGVQAQDQARQSRDAHFASDDARLASQARESATVANGLYGSAAGLAVLGGVFLFVF